MVPIMSPLPLGDERTLTTDPVTMPAAASALAGREIMSIIAKAKMHR
jgi:hypothetical protein